VIIEFQELLNRYGFILSFTYVSYLSCYTDRPGFIPTLPNTNNNNGTNLVQQYALSLSQLPVVGNNYMQRFFPVCFTVLSRT